jgi:probable O-glycosylation ligase (exosortase A-associated)
MTNQPCAPLRLVGGIERVLRSLYISAVFLAFVVLGAATPFIYSLGYIWVDTFRPQELSYFFLNQIPVSLIMAALAIGSYVLIDRRSPAPVTIHTILTILLGIWVTITTIFFAVAPDTVWVKWDWAFKTIMFSAFIPLVFRSKIQIEAFLGIYIFSAAVHIVPVGLKTMINGGGYGQELGVVGGNSLFSEGSTLAAASLVLIPVTLYLRKHSQILPQWKIVKLGYLALIAVMLAAAIGTYARTGLIGIIVLIAALWLRSDRKILGALVAAAIAMSVMAFTSTAWNERISTISDYQSEDSALGRILVWQWTLQFVATHPAGGGFNSYQINEVRFPPNAYNPEGEIARGKAFHSIYFEVLGEHGWPGIILFGGLALTSLISLQNVVRRVRLTPELASCRDLAFALQVSLVVLLACGLFIGVAFQPMLYYLFALSACVSHHAQRVQLQNGGISTPSGAILRRYRANSGVGAGMSPDSSAS